LPAIVLPEPGLQRRFDPTGRPFKRRSARLRAIARIFSAAFCAAFCAAFADGRIDARHSSEGSRGEPSERGPSDDR
jgi:hypothetical protein